MYSNILNILLFTSTTSLIGLFVYIKHAFARRASCEKQDPFNKEGWMDWFPLTPLDLRINWQACKIFKSNK